MSAHTAQFFYKINICYSGQLVQERMLCHAIIGRAGGKELIMKVDISCQFIAPLLEFSSDQVFFKVIKVSEAVYTISR